MAKTIAESFAALEKESILAWRDWAKQVANGGDPPHPRSLLEVGAHRLGYCDPRGCRSGAEAAGSQAWERLGIPCRRCGTGCRYPQETPKDFRGEQCRLSMLVAGTDSPAT